jgi:ABC-type phosphate/phosphonate transport system substrate-binding protein
VARQLRVIHQSPELPTSPVVSFGPVDDAVRNLVRVLLDMKKDQEGHEVLKALQTDGFGAPDEGLRKLTLKMEGQNVRCSP